MKRIFTAVTCLAVLTLLSACASHSPQPRPGAPVPEETTVRALDADPQDVYIRIVDVGPALCAVINVPGGHSMVFDAGHWVGKQCLNAVRELVIQDTIDVMILSHSDADHLGDAAQILDEKRVSLTMLAGEPRTTASWTNLINALSNEVREGGSVHNLQTLPIVPGRTLALGDATLTLIAGWARWTEPGPTAAERRNAISIVVRLEYKGRSILFTGDTVGKRLADGDDACKDAERVMAVRHNAGEVNLKSDVLVASHHGGNNGSASCFIQAISPTFVIFSAGHNYQHPTAAAARRFLAQGLDLKRLFRTDFGDDEPGSFEWEHGTVAGCSDPPGDDDVEVVLRADGSVDVDYLRPAKGCDSRGAG